MCKTYVGFLGAITSLVTNFVGLLIVLVLILSIVASVVWTKVEPMYQEARETAFDKLVNLDEDDFTILSDTKIYSNKGKLIGTVNAGHFEYAEIQNISKYVYEGYIAVEDRRFKEHSGVDLRALIRAGVALVQNSGEKTQGGSTITQQVVKNTMLTQEKSYQRKLTEVMLAPAIENKFNKDKIMEIYCNTNYYGNSCYGIESASRYYFGKKAAELQPHEAALLVGLSNAPGRYDPVLHPDEALEKRNRVLEQMLDNGAITEKQYNKCIKKKLNIVQEKAEASEENYQTSYAIHCAALSLMEQEGFEFKYTFADKKEYNEYTEKYSEEYNNKTKEIRAGGYKIYTSLDKDVQKVLQESVSSGLSGFTAKDEETGKYEMQGAGVCVDNKTGYVIAIVGGRDKKDEFNRAYIAARQPGSTIKPLIDYAPALETGKYYPSKLVNDAKTANGPSNYGTVYRGYLPLREAVGRSLNTVAWSVLSDVGPDVGLSYLGNMRFNKITYVDNNNLSLSLGGFTNGVRVVDMAKGYATLANYGKYSSRTCIRKIERENKGVVYTDEEEITQVYSEDTAFMMTDILKGVISQDYGTAKNGKIKGQIVAGKTGTTNNYKDAWFCGYSRYYTTSIWMGYDSGQQMAGITGGSYPLTIWKDFMTKLHSGKAKSDWTAPSTCYKAFYDASGNETSADTGHKDWFSSAAKKRAEEAARLKSEKEYNAEVNKLLTEFESFNISNVEDTFSVDDKYKELDEKIALIVDDDTRAKYSKRLQDKYEELQEVIEEWEPVIKEYKAQKKKEKEKEKKKAKKEAEKARKEQEKQVRLNSFNYYLGLLENLKYKQTDTAQTIQTAKDKLELLREYDEYTDCANKLKAAIERVNSLMSYSAYKEKLRQEEERVEREKEQAKEDVDDVADDYDYYDYGDEYDY